MNTAELLPLKGYTYSHYFFSLYRLETNARFHITVRTQINKSMVYSIVRRNVKFGYSEC